MYTQHKLFSYKGKGPQQIELGYIDYAVPINHDLSIELHTLYINPEFRGKRFSKKMLINFIEKMKSAYPNIPSIRLENRIGTDQYPFNTSIEPTKDKTIKNIHTKIKNIYTNVGFVYENKGTNDMIYKMKGNKSVKHSPNHTSKHSANKSVKHSPNHTSKNSANKSVNNLYNPSPTKKRKPLKGR